MIPETKYIIDGTSVIPVVELNDEWLVPSNVIFKKNEKIVFSDKLDAQYVLLLLNLKKGKLISNYKSSKYYQYYIDRLKNENPEYLI